MKSWLPITIALVLSFLMNFFPYFMAFILEVEGWAEAGWAFYFFTIPFSALLLLVGFAASLFLWLRRRKHKNSPI